MLFFSTVLHSYNRFLHTHSGLLLSQRTRSLKIVLKVKTLNFLCELNRFRREVLSERRHRRDRQTIDESETKLRPPSFVGGRRKSDDWSRPPQSFYLEGLRKEVTRTKMGSVGNLGDILQLMVGKRRPLEERVSHP